MNAVYYEKNSTIGFVTLRNIVNQPLKYSIKHNKSKLIGCGTIIIQPSLDNRRTET